jgi:S-adenosylmethionine decarboxylase
MSDTLQKNEDINPLMEDRLDYFVRKDGLVYAGTHLVIDLWNAKGLNDPDLIEATLRKCATVSGATILHFHMHAFDPDGLSGVLVLAESHISFHSWPERNFMALDIFMCGKTDPYQAIPVLKESFAPETLQLSELKRGIIS